MSERAIIRRGVRVLSLSAGISNGFYLLRTLVLIRYFGAANYGLVSLLQSIPQFFTLLLVNTDYFLIRFLPSEIEKRQTGKTHRVGLYIMTSFITQSAFRVFFGLLIVGLAPVLCHWVGQPEMILAIRLLGLTVALSPLQGPVDTPLLNAFQMFGFSASIEAVDAFTSLFAVLLTWYFQWDITQFFLASLLTQLFSFLYFQYLALHFRGFFFRQEKFFSLEVAKEMIRFSYPVVLRRSISEIYLIPLRFIVARILGLTAVGYFSFAYNLYGKLNSLLLILHKAITATLNRSVNFEEFRHRFNRIFLNYNYIYLVLALCSIYFAKEIILVFGGKSFEPALPSFVLAAIYFYAWQISTLIFLQFVFLKRTLAALNLAVLRVVFTLLLAVPALILFKNLEWVFILDTLALLASWFITGATSLGSAKRFVEDSTVKQVSYSILLLTLAILSAQLLPHLLARVAALLTALALATLLHSRQKDFEVLKEMNLLLWRRSPSSS